MTTWVVRSLKMRTKQPTRRSTRPAVVRRPRHANVRVPVCADGPNVQEVLVGNGLTKRECSGVGSAQVGASAP